VPRRLIFNVDFEERLAGRSPRIEPGLARKLAARFLFLGSAEDVLEADWELPEAFRARFPGLPRVAARGSGPPALLEWAPTEPAATVRRVNSKPFAHALAARLGLGPPGVLCDSVREVAERLPQGRWVVKRPFGHGGRGHFLGAGPALPPNAPGWIEKALAPGEPVLLEPWVEREADYSTQLEVGDEPTVLACLELLTTPQGAYVGNRVGTVPDAVARELASVARATGAALQGEGYRGPVGVDAYASAGKLRPLVEVNARHTFGRVALAIARRLGAPIASWLTVPGPWKGALEGAGWRVTDPFAHESGPTSVFLWAGSRDELLALEERVLASQGVAGGGGRSGG
jgi:hypothetical protein